MKLNKVKARTHLLTNIHARTQTQYTDALKQIRTQAKCTHAVTHNHTHTHTGGVK